MAPVGTWIGYQGVYYLETTLDPLEVKAEAPKPGSPLTRLVPPQIRAHLKPFKPKAPLEPLWDDLAALASGLATRNI